MDTSPPLYYLCCYSFTTLFSSISLYYSSIGIYFLYRTKTQKSIISPMIKTFFVYNFSWSLISTFYNFYLTLLWRPDTVIYNAYIMFFVSITCTIFLIFNPIIEIFLCLDRCISIALFKTNFPNLNRYTVILCAVTWVSIFYATTNGNNFFNKIPVNSVTVCRYHGCMVALITNSYGLYIILALGFLTIFAGILLFYLIKTQIKTSTVVKSSNNTVVMVIVVATFSYFLPNIFYQILSRIVVFSFEIPPATISLHSINVAIGLQMYAKIFKKNLNKTKTFKITTVS